MTVFVVHLFKGASMPTVHFPIPLGVHACPVRYSGCGGGLQPDRTPGVMLNLTLAGLPLPALLLNEADAEQLAKDIRSCLTAARRMANPIKN
jgi:hypothetical protein